MPNTHVISAQLTKHAFLIRDYEQGLLLIRVLEDADNSVLFAFHIDEDHDFQRAVPLEDFSCSVDRKLVIPALLLGLWWLWRNEIFTTSRSEMRDTMMSALPLMR